MVEYTRRVMYDILDLPMAAMAHLVSHSKNSRALVSLAATPSEIRPGRFNVSVDVASDSTDHILNIIEGLDNVVDFYRSI